MSKGLEALKEALRHTQFVFYGKGQIEEQIKNYSENLSIVEKELKALEIIKTANLNVVYYGYIDDRDVYALRVGELEIKYNLSQEEYELLKEVLL